MKKVWFSLAFLLLLASESQAMKVCFNSNTASEYCANDDSRIHFVVPTIIDEFAQGIVTGMAIGKDNSSGMYIVVVLALVGGIGVFLFARKRKQTETNI